MPKDEFDPHDPLELNGVAMFTEEDTTDPMCECFVEEFMRMGHNHKQILALFRNPHYLGMNLVLQNRGEQFVRDQIVEIFARWGREVTWREADSGMGSARASRAVFGAPAEHPPTDSTCPPIPVGEGADGISRGGCAPQEIEFDSTLTDPMGAALPKLNL